MKVHRHQKWGTMTQLAAMSAVSRAEMTKRMMHFGLLTPARTPSNKAIALGVRKPVVIGSIGLVLWNTEALRAVGLLPTNERRPSQTNGIAKFTFVTTRRGLRGKRNRPSESGSNDDWATPAWLFRPLHKEFGFTVDVAASFHNAKLFRFYSRRRNGLKQSWVKEVVWLNPPFHKDVVGKWVRKAYEESRLGAIVVGLLPARTHADWFHLYCLPYAEIRFVEGWVPFRGRHRSNTQMCLVAIFRPNGIGAIGPSIPKPNP